MRLRIGTRGSDLALTQSRAVAALLGDRGVATELVVITTSGDRSAAPTFGAIGPQGVFVREIEEALLERQIDCAVHSYKDLPTTSPAGLVVAAVPERRDVADWLLCRREARSAGDGLLPLGRGARVGTSSARRQAWLRHYRPDLAIAPLRGNVPTRIRRLAAGDYDAIVLAGAGIDRLNEAGDTLAAHLAGLEQTRLDPERFVPAPAQGALALQCRESDAAIREALGSLDATATRRAVTLERAALALAEGGCDTAFGAHARAAADGVTLTLMTERDGRILMSRVSAGPVASSASVAENDARALARQAIDGLEPLAGGGA
jgi:hydroxymethylbilane synthase